MKSLVENLNNSFVNEAMNSSVTYAVRNFEKYDYAILDKTVSSFAVYTTKGLDETYGEEFPYDEIKTLKKMGDSIVWINDGNECIIIKL